MLTQEEFDMIIQILSDAIGKWENYNSPDPGLQVAKSALRKLQSVAPS